MSDRLSGTPGTANGRRRPRGGAAGVWGLGSTVALKTVHGEQPKADTLGIRLSARPGDLAYRVSTLFPLLDDEHDDDPDNDPEMI